MKSIRIIFIFNFKATPYAQSIIVRTFCLVTLIFCSSQLKAQDYPRTDYNLEKLADEIFPIQDLDLNYEELYENLAQLLSNPLNLNLATSEELRSLFVLSETQIEEFIHYRQEQGPLLSVYELQSVPSFDLDVIPKLIPFVIVQDPSSILNKSIWKRLWEEKNNYLLLRYERTLENKKGYLTETDSTARYVGLPDKLYSRFRINRIGDFSLGFTIEKDAGEGLRWNPSSKEYGFDFNSIHAQVMNKGQLKNLIVGDYQAQFGQGLVLGGGFGMGKGSESIATIRRSNLGFVPYTSLNESGYFEGVATTISIRNSLSLSSFVSAVDRDGRPGQSTTSEDINSISSVGTTGFHRTISERENRKKIKETNYGVILNYKNKSFEGGLMFHETQFIIPVYREPAPYNQFTFNGDRNSNASAYLNYTWSNFTFFGEAAKTLHYGNALTLGSLGSLSSKFDISLLYRNFAKDFHSFYSNAISENTLPQNESGFYWGMKYLWTRKHSMSGYVDLFRFPGLRFRGYSPSIGREWLLRFNYKPSKTVNLFVQVREESKIRNLSTESTLYQTGVGSKKNFWFNLDYVTSQRLNFKTRVQFSTYTINSNRTEGFAIVQDVNYNAGRFTFSTRYALFDTDDYDNRQYLYERDVWLAFSIPAVYGVGVRSYAMVQYKVNQKIDVWLRFAQTSYADRDTIGTGGETIYGNTKNDLKFQVRIRI